VRSLYYTQHRGTFYFASEIVEAVRELEREKGIETGTLVAALEDALLAAYKKTPGAARHATVKLDDEGDFRVYAIELPPDRVKLAIGGDELRPLAQRKRREESHDQLMRVGCQRDPLRRIVEQPREPTPHLVGLLEGEIPHLVDVLGGVEPGLLLRFERYVRPRLMRVPSEKDALRYTKPRVMLR